MIYKMDKIVMMVVWCMIHKIDKIVMMVVILNILVILHIVWS